MDIGAELGMGHKTKMLGVQNQVFGHICCTREIRGFWDGSAISSSCYAMCEAVLEVFVETHTVWKWKVCKAALQID